MSMKNSNDTTWNRTSDLPICNTAPYPLCYRGPPTTTTTASIAIYFTLVVIQLVVFFVKFIYLVLLLTLKSFDLLAQSSAVLNLVNANVRLEKDFGVAFHELYFFPALHM